MPILKNSQVVKVALEVGRYFLGGKWQDLYRDVLSEAERAKRQAGFARLKVYLMGRTQEFLIEKM
ncbi:hypothetical protein [Pararcticibacter amylolyticus]|uniref:Uncharacterized protein n=1 Tax=Pararcticibacter amylolyticus TaxID=2173175 RepID=A0A2U2PEG3_9SPHI|nr:hypothetical protein [Pararcticibacter amylolyticus]PWG79788.1 hypothetical protein DDR33_15365 [Pararcticibacter amylolyticus]